MSNYVFKSEWPNPQSQTFYNFQDAFNFAEFVVCKSGVWKYIGIEDSDGLCSKPDDDKIEALINKHYGIETSTVALTCFNCSEKSESNWPTKCNCYYVHNNIKQYLMDRKNLAARKDEMIRHLKKCVGYQESSVAPLETRGADLSLIQIKTSEVYQKLFETSDPHLPSDPLDLAQDDQN